MNWLVPLLIVVAGFNVAACIGIARSASLSAPQRWIQAVMVWLFPVVGAVVMLSFLSADRRQHGGIAASADTSLAGDEAALAEGESPCGCADGGGGDD